MMPCPMYEKDSPNTQNSGDDMLEACCSEWLSHQIESHAELLILDCRAPNEYQASHIQGAIHVHLPTLMLRRLKKGNLPVAQVIKCAEGKEKFNSKWKSETLVLYDDSPSDTRDNPTSVVCLLSRKLREDGCKVKILEGGFSAFEEKYPHICVSVGPKDCEESTILGLRNLNLISETDDHPPGEEDTTPNSSSTPFPVEVLPCLFLGNAKNAADRECLARNNIQYILNVTPDVPNTFAQTEGFKYMQIPITDHWSQNLCQYFPKAISFIDEAREKQCGMLVHCLAGISRSVTVTVAYLMHHLHVDLNEAYDQVKRCKPNISPNFNFMGQLMDFQKTLNLPECSCARNGEECTCSCRDAKTYFSSPTSSLSSGFSSNTNSSTSASEFDYEVPPTPS